MTMKKPFRQSVVTFVLVVAVTTGCRSTSEYKKLADAGNEYTNAVDKLLVVATNSYIEIDSLFLLDRQSEIREAGELSEDGKRQLETTFRTSNETGKKRIELYKAIREHNKLLGEYFQVLSKLADSQSSTSLQGKITTIVSNLTGTGKIISAASSLISRESKSSINSPVSSEFTGALRSELEQRKDVILREIIIQKEILEVMGELMKQDSKYISEKAEESLRNQLIDQDISSEDARALWIANRRNFLTMDTTAKELREASQALSNFQAVFQAFIEGKSNLDQLKNASKGLKAFSQPLK
jgi:glutathione peroxidase-family protein